MFRFLQMPADPRKRGGRVGLLLTAALLALPPGGALGDTRAPAWRPDPDPGPPVDFDGGLDTRIREVSLHNLLDFDDDAGPMPGAPRTASDSHFFRVRHRVWGQFKLRSGSRLYSRFTTEWRKYLTPYLTPEKTEIILDNLYVSIPDLPGLPIFLRLGRQDLSRGEGFILADGGPNDGTRSSYHNAILLGLRGERMGLGKTKLEVMAIRNPAWDEFVIANGPTNAQKESGARQPMVQDDDTAFGCYVTNTSLKDEKVEAYYFYKEEESPAARDPHLKLHTLGARLSGKLPAALDFAIEGAYQFGTHVLISGPEHNPDPSAGTYDHQSFGGYAWLSRSLLTFTRPTLKIGVVYLSGDDPGDPGEAGLNTKGWIPIFSRYPKWSELYVYTLAAEPARIAATLYPEEMILIPEPGREANWTNLFALHAGLTLQLTEKTALDYTYYYLRAPESLADLDLNGGDQQGFFGSGRVRGHNHQWQVTVEMNDSVAWHFLAERFAPGDFYSGNDDAYFLRWDLTWKK